MAATRDAGDAAEREWIAPAFRDAMVGLAVFDGELGCVYSSPHLPRLLGRDPGAPVHGEQMEDLFAGPDAALVSSVARDVLRGSDETVTDADVRIAVGAAGVLWLRGRWFSTHLPSGAPGVGIIVAGAARRRDNPYATLQQLTSEFSAAVTPEAVAEVVIRAVRRSVAADGGALYLLNDTRTMLSAIRTGYTWATDNPFSQLTLDEPIPVVAAVRSGEPVWITDEAELHERFPAAVDPAVSAESWGAHVALPLSVGGEVIGAIVFSWAQGQTLTLGEQSFLAAVADQCAQALQRALAFAQERAARQHTERVADQVLRLERITGALASASEPAQVVELFLDQCLEELGASHGAVFEIDPRIGALVPLGARSNVWDPRPVPLDASGPLAETVRTGHSVLLSDRLEIQSMVGDPAVPLATEQAWAAIPLVAYGETLGAVALRYEGDWQFDLDDRAFLDRVGRRLAEALERSRLYAQQREAREQAEGAARWLRSVQSLAAALARSATRRDVARALREHLQPATRADYSIVAALSSDRRSLDVLTGRSSFAMSTDEIGESVRGAVREAILRGRSIELEDPTAIGATFPGLTQSGLKSFALLPIRAGGMVAGVIGMGWSTPGALTPDARRLLAIAVSLGGAAFERAAAYDLDHHIAETLQRHLLTEPAFSMPGASWAARYAPGSVDLTAGGDWYDVIDLPGDRVGLVVGDIVGHGVLAAAAMGQLRSATRALAVRENPVGVLEALDAYANTTGQGELSSLAYVVLDPAACTAEYAVAGHPPPLIRRADGTTEFVEDAQGPLVGIGAAGTRRSVVHRFEPGSTIVLYTDGVVERRGESIDEGLRRLAETVTRASPALHPEALCDLVLDDLDVGGGAPDDVTLLVLALDPVTPDRNRSFPARLEMLRVIRSDVRAWLDRMKLDESAASDIVLACGEACANAVEHGGGAGRHDTFDVQLRADDHEVVVAVTGAGLWADERASGDRAHGLQIIDALMDDVQIAAGEQETTVTMRRHRRAVDRGGQ